MILVLCSRADRGALEFAKRHASEGVRAVSCLDVSRQGWTLEVRQGFVSATAMLGNVEERPIGSGRAPQIEGVITRLGYVSEAEVGHVVPDERPYVAAEMQAFLFAFLAGLACPKVNAPSLGCLYAPHLRASNWRRLAREVGLVVDDRQGGYDATTDHADVTVVGGRAWGDAPAHAHRMTLQLAAAAGVVHLRARYRVGSCDVRFCGADAYPQIESEEIGQALIRFCRNDGAH